MQHIGSAEEWRPVLGYEGRYEVSNVGRVRSVDRTVEVRGQVPRRLAGQVLETRLTTTGYPAIRLSRGEENPNARPLRKTCHLVLEAFVGQRPPGAICRHLDDDKTNNHLENLRWGTASENRFDSVRNGSHVWANRTQCPQGHEYTAENTYVLPSRPNARYCRECRRATRNAARDRRVAEARAARVG